MEDDILNETNRKKASAGNTLVSLDKFPGADRYDMERVAYILGQ